MTAFFQTSLLFVLTVLTTFVAGYGVTTLMASREWDEYRFVVAPAIGYPILVILTHLLSGSFQLSVLVAGFISYSLLACLSVYTYVRIDRSRGLSYIGQRLASAALLSAPIVIVVLWPMFVVGANTFLASINPDFYAGLADNEWLKFHPTDAFKGGANKDAYDIFGQISGTTSQSARFRGAYVAILLGALFRIPQRTALTLLIALFHYCMPASLYFMARVAFKQNRRVSYLSAALLGISSSISLGYLSYYIGQASALGFVPLLITIWFLCLTRPSVRLAFLASLLTCAMWVMYFGLIPYVAGPILGLALYLLVTRQLSLGRLLGMAAGLCSMLVLIHARMMGTFIGGIKAWLNLAGNTTAQGQYYIDFVTERFFPMFYGLSIYPVDLSRYREVIGHRTYDTLILVLSVTVSIGLLVSLFLWIRKTTDGNARALGISCVVAYAGVALNYIFLHPYGYGAFKNATWLQFFLVFFVAFGISQIYEVLTSNSRSWKKALAAVFGLLAALPVVTGNLASSAEYGYKALGHDTNRGYIVVLHNMSGNEDYFQLEEAVGKFVKPNESVGMAFINVAQNAWAAYYLRNFRLSYLGQYLLPGDDENLPDVVTRRVVDPYGNVQIDSPTFSHGDTDDYYLVNRQGVVNSEIVKNVFPRVLWQDSTFMLVRSSDTPDFMYVGRGFYRIEFRAARDYYSPAAIRWTAEGGEIYLLRPSQPGKPYRLALTGLAGPGLDTVTRTLEFYHNKDSFGSPKVIHGFGRIVSDPFYPTGGVDRIVFKIREKTRPTARQLALWAKDLPTDYRRTNLAVSDIELITPGWTASAPKLNETISKNDLFTKSVTFDGIEPNYWVRDEMSISFPRATSSCAVSMSIFAPPHPSFLFPFDVTITIDGIAQRKQLGRSGATSITLNLAEKHGSDITTIQLKPSQVFKPEGYSSDRPVVHSVRLDGITFKDCATRDEAVGAQ